MRGGPSTLLKDIQPTGDDFLVMAPSFRAPTRQGLDACLRVLKLRQALLEFDRVEVHGGRGKAFLRAQTRATNIVIYRNGNSRCFSLPGTSTTLGLHFARD